VETHTFTLLGNRQTDFLPHIQAFQAALADYRTTTRRLTYHANTLAAGRTKELETLTQQVLDAWRDDPSPPARGDAPPPNDLAADDPLQDAAAGAAAPPLVPDLITLFGPSLTEECAPAQGETA
jgi:hypothetical protein